MDYSHIMASLQKIIFVFALFFCVPFLTDAANLSLSPTPGTHTIGGTFSMQVVVNSADQAMNAASGIVSFPQDKMEVVSLSKSGSIFSLWPAEPVFSNALGTINFEGIVLNPGYVGSYGTILTITFRAKAEGQANISFASGSVLANDGLGTNILKSLQATTASFVVPVGVVVPEVVTPVSPANSNALNITSSTHPDQAKWYVNNTPEFSWTLPDGALETRTYISKSATSAPLVSYIPAISKKKLDDELSDGTYYFSAQVRTNVGWGPVSRYKVNVDVTPPKPFSIKFLNGNSTLTPQPAVYFTTTDDISGISYYDIYVGSNGKPDRVSSVTMSNPYLIPAQTPGTYELIVTAVDGAGNIRSHTSEFVIEGIDSPTITDYPEMLELGDILQVKGTTYANSNVYVTIYENGSEILQENVRSNAFGDFIIVITKKLAIGTYTFSAHVIDENGAQSKMSDPFPLSVKSRVLSDLIDIALEYMSITILSVLIFGGAAGFMIFVGFRVTRLYRNMRKKAETAEVVSVEAFNILREDITKHINKFEKAKLTRTLSKEEIAFLKNFEKSLEEAENIVIKEIKEVSKK